MIWPPRKRRSLGPWGHPTLSDGTAQVGSGVGTFTASLAGLSAGTTYHYRAYATNPAGSTFSYERGWFFLPLGIGPRAGLPQLQGVLCSTS